MFPDPVLGFTWDRARSAEGPSGTETGWSVSQTIPWPGTFSATVRAADQQATVFRREGLAMRWSLEIEARATFARLLYARAAVEIAREAVPDALALKDLTTKRADLGESREVDRIKAEVSRKIVAFKLREGRAETLLDVTPGPHEMPVEVTWDQGRHASTKVVDVASGSTGLLEVRGGRVTKDPSLSWSRLAKD